MIRSSDGDFIQAFARRLGHCSIQEAELWAIWYGMRMASDQGIPKVLVETDCMEAVRLLEDDCQHANQFWELLYEIRNLKNTFQHCVRDIAFLEGS